MQFSADFLGRASITAEEDDTTNPSDEAKDVMNDAEQETGRSATAVRVKDEPPTDDDRAITLPKASHHSPHAAMTETELKEEARGDQQNRESIEGDSEAETLIQSPEKKPNVIEGAPVLQPSSGSTTTQTTQNQNLGSESNGKGRKRKRGDDDTKNRGTSHSSSRHSSPLSSPMLQGASNDSDSDVLASQPSPTLDGVRARKRKAIVKDGTPDSDERNVTKSISSGKGRRRRPSDILSQPPKHRNKDQNTSIDGSSHAERRETRSATYPRHSSDERSLSPRPTSRREHRRGASTQLTSLNLDKKRRSQPLSASSKRHRSADRRSVSSESSNSPAPSRPRIPKLNNADHDTLSPAKHTGPRKFRDKNGRTFLARACNNNDLAAAKTRLAERPQDLNIADNAGNTPLQIAALEGFTDIVKFLLEQNCEVDTKNIDKESPLIDAVENGHVEVVKLLLDYGANPRLGNAKGDEPYELVPIDDENYHAIRRLLAEAKEKDNNRRKSDDQVDTGNRDGSSRAPSAASPRDSPPVPGPRSPPLVASRRRTGRSESTRNDLLWQANTQDNLTRLAGKGDAQGVASILNILQKAEPESLIAAAKAGHEEVLQLLLGMGEPDPDPEPIRSPNLKSGFNTPMLAAIGRGNPDVIKLLVNQSGFNPTREYKGRKYYEISQERKGQDWQTEYEILKKAYDHYVEARQRKHTSARKSKEIAKDKPSLPREPSSPAATKSRFPPKSPTASHRELPKEASKSPQEEVRKEAAPDKYKRQHSRKITSEPSAAGSSDVDNSAPRQKASHKIRRSQSDLSTPQLSLEPETSQRRRRLITGKEHRRGKSYISDDTTEDEKAKTIEQRADRKEKPPLKRMRRSLSPDAMEVEQDDAGAATKKRRTQSDARREVSRSSLQKDAQIPSRNDAATHSQISTATIKDEAKPSSIADDSQVVKEEEESAHNDHDIVMKEPHQGPDDAEKAAQEQAEAEARAREAEAEARRQAEELEAKKRAEEEAQRMANELEAKRRAEELEAKRKAEEELARKRAEEEALARKKEEEERLEQLRREQEERRRRQEEQRRQEFLEAERRKREALPVALCRLALMLDQADPHARSLVWLSKFLPLFTVRTRQISPSCGPDIAEEEWVPNFQVAALLAIKDLNLLQYTSLEKRSVSHQERECLWRVARNMLSFDYEVNAFNTSVDQARLREEENRPKFFAIEALFWVKVRIRDGLVRSQR